MITFLLGLVALLLGYLIYGKIAERIFTIKPDAQTPANRLNDGVDYVPMSKWRCLLLHLINIAGTGPIFGAIAGALFGPAAFIWIVFGCIFAGSVHDYTVSMLSLRNDGCNISTIVGKYLGKKPQTIMRVFSLVLLIFVGVVFTTTPAMVLRNLFAPESVKFYYFAIALIIGYYVLATMISIDKIIGRIYPFIGGFMIFMAVGMFIFLFVSGDVSRIPEFSFQNMRPDQGTNILGRIFPFLFITIACGAISGFHATQGPLVARCMMSEKEGRMVFYGAMILEGVIAMIWAAVAMTFINQDGVRILGNLNAVAAPVVVTRSAIGYMGAIGGTIAVVGVALFPITSGDTAFRCARLIIAETLKFDQKPIKNRLAIALPIFIVGILLVIFSLGSVQNFNIIWRYFAWSNQTLATIGLWAASAYLAKTGKTYWLTLIPATFMTTVVSSYFLTANECMGPAISKITGNPETTLTIGIVAGIVLAITFFGLFISQIAIKQRGTLQE